MPLALVSGSVSSPSYYYVHTGQIDEPLIVTDASKAKVWDAALDPWGQATMLATPTKDLNLRLPGQWYSAESGLHQNWMRDYDPVTGRYIEADPLGINAGANLYPYTGSNPLNRTDPTGQIVPLAIAGVCAGGGCEVIGLTILAALGWTATHPFTLPPTASTIPQAASDCPPNDDDRDPQCHKASKWELEQAGIFDEHEYKREAGAVPTSRFDICKCRDGSIRIAESENVVPLGISGIEL